MIFFIGVSHPFCKIIVSVNDNNINIKKRINSMNLKISEKVIVRYN